MKKPQQSIAIKKLHNKHLFKPISTFNAISVPVICSLISSTTKTN